MGINRDITWEYLEKNKFEYLGKNLWGKKGMLENSFIMECPTCRNLSDIAKLSKRKPEFNIVCQLCQTTLTANLLKHDLAKGGERK